MSIFGSIMEKLGFGHKEPAQVTFSTASTHVPPVAHASAPVAPAPAAPITMSAVDVVSKLDQLASASGQTLNWRQSIVDLMKLLGLDSSIAARKQLAAELHCPANLMDDSAQMNMWLHKVVLQQVAANGGNVPANLLS